MSIPRATTQVCSPKCTPLDHERDQVQPGQVRRPGHRNPASAQGHRPAVPVPGRGPLGVVAALGPQAAGHVGFHDRGHHLAARCRPRGPAVPRACPRRSRPTPRSPSPARPADSCRSHWSGNSAHRRSPSPSRCSWQITRVPTPWQVSGGGPPPKFHESRNNLDGEVHSNSYSSATLPHERIFRMTTGQDVSVHRQRLQSELRN